MPGLTGGRRRSGNHGEPERCARGEPAGLSPTTYRSPTRQRPTSHPAIAGPLEPSAARSARLVAETDRPGKTGSRLESLYGRVRGGPRSGPKDCDPLRRVAVLGGRGRESFARHNLTGSQANQAPLGPFPRGGAWRTGLGARIPAWLPWNQGPARGTNIPGAFRRSSPCDCRPRRSYEPAP